MKGHVFAENSLRVAVQWDDKDSGHFAVYAVQEVGLRSSVCLRGALRLWSRDWSCFGVCSYERACFCWEWLAWSSVVRWQRQWSSCWHLNQKNFLKEWCLVIYTQSLWGARILCIYMATACVSHVPRWPLPVFHINKKWQALFCIKMLCNSGSSACLLSCV